MNINEMKSCMAEIVQNVSEKYPGGESYFTELDSMIKANTPLLLSYCQWVYQQTRNPLVLSGEIGELMLNLRKCGFIQGPAMIIVNGGLRSGSGVEYMKFWPTDFSCPPRTKFTMIDDSYYSGKTAQKVDEALRELGYELENIYVFYDGSVNKPENVNSLYRYYGGNCLND